MELSYDFMSGFVVSSYTAVSPRGFLGVANLERSGCNLERFSAGPFPSESLARQQAEKAAEQAALGRIAAALACR